MNYKSLERILIDTYSGKGHCETDMIRSSEMYIFSVNNQVAEDK